MTPAWCPKSGTPSTDEQLDEEGVSVCPGCARVVLVVDGRIRRHRLPARVA